MGHTPGAQNLGRGMLFTIFVYREIRIIIMSSMDSYLYYAKPKLFGAIFCIFDKGRSDRNILPLLS